MTLQEIQAILEKAHASLLVQHNKNRGNKQLRELLLDVERALVSSQKVSKEEKDARSIV